LLYQFRATTYVELRAIPQWVDSLAMTYLSLAALSRDQGNPQQRKSELDRAAELYRSLERALPDLPVYRESLAATLTDIGLIDFDLGHIAQARQNLEESLTIYQQLANYYPLVDRFQVGLATALDGLGQVILDGTNDHQSAEAIFADSHRIFDSLARKSAEAGDGNSVDTLVQRAAIVLSHWAQLQSQQLRFDEAETNFQDARNWLSTLSETAPDVEDYRFSLGHVAFRQAEHLRRKSVVSPGADAAANQQESLANFQLAFSLWQRLAEQSPTTRHQSQLAWFHLNCPESSLVSITQAVTMAKLAFEQSPLDWNSQELFLASLIAAEQFDEAQGELSNIKTARTELNSQVLICEALIEHSDGNQDATESFLNAAARWLDANRPGNYDLRRRLDAMAAKCGVELAEASAKTQF
jgi:tetratricopeptide (TPR) repeat protein